MVGAFGNYSNLKTPIHKFDSRLKFLSFIFLVTIVFLNLGFIGYIFKLVVVLILMFMSKMSVRTFYSSLKTVLILFITLFIIQWLMVKPGSITLGNGSNGVGKLLLGEDGAWYSLYEGAIWRVLDIVFKVVLMINLTNILMSTTSPIDLTLAIEDLFSPLKKIKISPHIPAMILSIAIRSVPTLIQEADRILKAQASRGADFKNGRFWEKITTMVSLIIPLFSISIQRAEDMADAMEIRGYDPYGERTRYRIFRMRLLDWIWFIIIVGALVTCVTIKYTDKYIHLYSDIFML